MAIQLKILEPKDKEWFIKTNQYAFRFGAEQYFDDSEMESQYEEEGEIISRETIEKSIRSEGAVSYVIMDEDKPVGGIVINVKGEKGDIDLFFVDPKSHSKGIGQAAWREIERIHSTVKEWETVTPCFEKRNIHFYVNKLGFHIVEYYNQYCRDPKCSEELMEMYRFQKVIS